jgi:hypothetical protein
LTGIWVSAILKKLEESKLKKQKILNAKACFAEKSFS